MSSTVESFYDNNAEREWARLESHRTEFAVTMRALSDYLPLPPAAILDVGSGPGRYSIALAQKGYAVTLLDLSPRELEFALSKAQEAGVELAGCMQGNALDLSLLSPDSYDAVLLMDPLYHLLTQEERQQAILQARGVLKKGGLLFAAFITRYAPLRYAAKFEPDLLTRGDPTGEELLAHGVNKLTKTIGAEQGTEQGRYFTDAYFAHPSEIRPLMESCGLRSYDLIGCEGVVARIEEKVNELSGALWEAWVELNYRVGKDPCLHGAAEHLLYVGRKL